MKKDLETITKAVRNEEYNVWNKENTRRNQQHITQSSNWITNLEDQVAKSTLSEQ